MNSDHCAGGYDQGVRAAVPGPDLLLDALLRPLSVDHHPPPGDPQCLLHSHPVNILQGEKIQQLLYLNVLYLSQLSPILNAMVVWWNIPR